MGPAFSRRRMALSISAFLAVSCSKDGGPTAPADPGAPEDSLAPLVSGYREYIIDRERLDKPWGKALGDMDGDGFTDALVGTLDGPIYWYAYPGWERRILSGRHGGDDLQVGDLDGDGRLDVVTNGSAIAWYRNPGGTMAGEWEESVIYSSEGSHDLAIADIDGDGRPDLAARVENGPTLIFFGNPDGTWQTVSLHLASGGTGLAMGDIDGDGRMDMAQNGYWLRQPGDPRREDWPRREITPWDRTCAAGIADMNGDGRGDVFLSVGHGNGRVSWFEAPEDLEDGSWKEHFIDSAGYVHRFHLADMDGDGDADLAFAEQHETPGKRVGIFRNRDGAGTEWEYAGLSDKGSHNLAMADLGSDGDLDFLGANWEEDSRPRVWIKEE